MGSTNPFRYTSAASFAGLAITAILAELYGTPNELIGVFGALLAISLLGDVAYEELLD